MKFIFDFDDFSPKNNNFTLLEEIKEHYPNFKVTLFTVPWESRFGDETPIIKEKYEKFCEAIIKSSDWIEIAVHGLTHKGRDTERQTPAEFEHITYDEAKKRVLVAEKMLINRKIPYTKIFKAPFWLLSKDGKRAIEDLEFKVAEDGYYNWNLKNDMPTRPLKKGKEEYMIGHGHIQNTEGNGIEETMWRILQIPTDTEFAFLSEYFDAEKVDPNKLDFRDPLERYELVEKK